MEMRGRVELADRNVCVWRKMSARMLIPAPDENEVPASVGDELHQYAAAGRMLSIASPQFVRLSPHELERYVSGSQTKWNGLNEG